MLDIYIHSNKAGEHVKAKTVVSSIQIPRVGGRMMINERKAGELIKEVIEKYHVVFVSAAGNVQNRDDNKNE